MTIDSDMKEVGYHIQVYVPQKPHKKRVAVKFFVLI